MENSATPLLNQPNQQGGIRTWIRTRSRDALSMLTLILLLGTALGIWVYGTLPTSDQDEHPHEYALSPSRIYHHLEQLMEIARLHNNSRSVQQGHSDSAEYVISQLHKHKHGGCDVHRQYFRSPVWKINQDPVLQIAGSARVDPLYLTDYRVMRYGGQGQHSLKNTEAATVSSRAACAAEEVHGVAGRVAVVFEHPGCTLFESAFGLEQQGALAVVFVGAAQHPAPSNARVRIADWKEGDPLMRIPVLSATHSLGQLLTAQGIRISLRTDTAIDIARTYNVLCVGREGDPRQTIMVGAHLDSVAAGPGMNDNGSGAMTILEILLTLEKLQYRPQNRLAFGWWAAEEDGLLGSRHFARTMQDIAVDLNFDMLASPNYISLIHNGTHAPKQIRRQSERIQHVFMDFFNRHKYPYQITDMQGGSDFLPFLLGGVPAGGVLTGAGETKTEEQRKKHGGMANAPLDPCYHRSCDSLGNINMEALDRMSRAAMHAVSLLSGKSDLDSFLNK